MDVNKRQGLACALCGQDAFAYAGMAASVALMLAGRFAGAGHDSCPAVR